ncbi:MAG: HAD-IIIC family phosphatase [Alphaproteobacteria bacterium]|nr:HAD-IIIC family phosphatase [Alphaproteobacteria bacterium]
MYGDLVARLLAARLGCTYKCLALDLDNTLWGGVVGDDGMDRLVLGQGSGLGEAFAAFQRYVRELSRRGVIVAICSKNDEVNAREAFERHPEMVLRPQDVAFFVANWNDKATNVQAIADSLRIGVDSVVFVDDNPFERNLVREKLPRAAVPEISDDPTGYPQVLADAGYFESVCVTDDDRARSAQYQANRQRQVIQSDSGDISSFLEGLSMRLLWRRFDSAGLARIVQLINKTNQFNLTTRRYSEAEVLAVMRDEGAIGLQLRLLDRFGDNGMIAVVIGRLDDGALRIDSWLMSCRVLGRQVEQATLNVIARQAARLGAKRLLGEYLPTAKNGMVREHYRRLGFTMVASDVEGGSTWVRELTDFVPADTCIEVVEG